MKISIMFEDGKAKYKSQIIIRLNTIAREVTMGLFGSLALGLGSVLSFSKCEGRYSLPFLPRTIELDSNKAKCPQEVLVQKISHKFRLQSHQQHTVITIGLSVCVVVAGDASGSSANLHNFFFELKYVVCSKHLTESAKQQAA